MKKLNLIIISILTTVMSFAQVPYFAGTPGDGNLYTYTSVKFRPTNDKNLETYTCFQYGIGNHFAVGSDLYTYGGSAYIGYLIRGNFYKSQYFSIGGQFTPSFDLSDSHRFSYATTGLYMNGAIYENLFWCSNTWWGANRDNTHSLNEWFYLGYTADFGSKGSLTPMVGYILNTAPADAKVSHDLAVGAYYTVGPCDIYAWVDHMIEKAPRVVIGIDFSLEVKKK